MTQIRRPPGRRKHLLPRRYFNIRPLHLKRVSPICAYCFEPTTADDYTTRLYAAHVTCELRDLQPQKPKQAPKRERGGVDLRVVDLEHYREERNRQHHDGGDDEQPAKREDVHSPSFPA